MKIRFPVQKLQFILERLRKIYTPYAVDRVMDQFEAATLSYSIIKVNLIRTNGFSNLTLITYMSGWEQIHHSDQHWALHCKIQSDWVLLYFLQQFRPSV